MTKLKKPKVWLTVSAVAIAVVIIALCLTNALKPAEKTEKLVDIRLYENMKASSMYYDLTVTDDGIFTVEKNINENKLSDSVKLTKDKLNYLKILTEQTHAFIEDDYSSEEAPYYIVSINSSASAEHSYGESFGTGCDLVLYYLIKNSPVEIVGKKDKPIRPYNILESNANNGTRLVQEYEKILDKKNNFNINFDYDSKAKTLTLSGKGRMEDYTYAGAWYSVSMPKNIVVNEGITSISEDAFTADCDGNSDTPRYDFQYTETVSLPESVTEIGERAFWECRKLKKINLPKNLKKLDEGAFASCQSLKKVVIPEEITKINISVFEECSSLEKVVLSNKTTHIYNGAFADDVSLKSVKLPKTLKVIDSMAFWGCKGIKEIKLPEGLKEIGDNAFHLTGLKSISIPRSVKKIGEEAFGTIWLEDKDKIIYDKSFTVYGYKGTAAEKYANKHKIKFVELSDNDN